MSPPLVAGTAFMLALVVSAVLTPAVRRWAVKTGRVARPREDRWHARPTALFGGVAIWAAFLAAAGLAVALRLEAGLGEHYGPLLLGASLMFAVGLADDLRDLSPQAKLVCQVVIAALLVFFGFKINWFTSYTLNTFLTVFWIVGITNAFNLLDNMDGLAAGIAVISAVFLAFIGVAAGGWGAVNGHFLMLAAFTGAVLGFLVYNFQPASIFMGDCGSLFIGVVLAALTTRHELFQSRHLLAVLFVPVLVLCLPILDMGFVSVMRTLFGRSIAQGGRDHSSHRLVAIGLPERKAVLTLYLFSVLGGAVAAVGALYPVTFFAAGLGLFALFAVFFWLHLAQVRIYPQESRTIVERHPALTSFWVAFTYKKRVLEVLLDVGLVSFGYWLSYFLRFEGRDYVLAFPLFLKTLPVVLVASLCAYLVFGIYRGVWRYTSVADLLTYLKAVTSAVVLGIIAIVFLYRFQDFSRTVFVIFWGVSLFFLGGSRLSFRILSESLRRNAVANGRRVLIYGAGDKGELALREILNNPLLGMTPVGFIDDDERKHRKRIQGYKVFGGRDRLCDIATRYAVNELVVATDKLRPENLKAAGAVCRDLGLALKSLELSIR